MSSTKQTTILPDKITQIREYLKMSVQMREDHGTTKIGDYYCMEDFVLRNGKEHKFQPLPDGYYKGEMKHCFGNSFSLMIDCPELIYVEGYAAGIIPTLHGYCVDEDGNVYDPTWDDGRAYFGVEFDRDFVRRTVLKNGFTCLIDDWQNQWPLLRDEKKEWSRKKS